MTTKRDITNVTHEDNMLLMIVLCCWKPSKTNDDTLRVIQFQYKLFIKYALENVHDHLSRVFQIYDGLRYYYHD